MKHTIGQRPLTDRGWRIHAVGRKKSSTSYAMVVAVIEADYLKTVFIHALLCTICCLFLRCLAHWRFYSHSDDYAFPGTLLVFTSAIKARTISSFAAHEVTSRMAECPPSTFSHTRNAYFFSSSAISAFGKIGKIWLIGESVRNSKPASLIPSRSKAAF